MRKIGMMFLGLLIALTIVVGLIPGMGLTAKAETNHTHEGVTFTEWTNASALPTEAGNYYLAVDVNVPMDYMPTVYDGRIIRLCLNGHKVTIHRNYLIKTGAKLEIFDDEGNGSIDASNMYGKGSMFCIDGNLTLNNGIVNGVVSTAGIIDIAKNGTFTMNGGKITGTAKDREDACVVRFISTNGTFNMNGGEITNTTTCAGVIFWRGNDSVSATAKINISGTAKIYNNRLENGDIRNLYLWNDNIKCNIINNLDPDAKIGITMNSPGVFTSGASSKAVETNFTSDDENYRVNTTETGELELVVASTIEQSPVASAITYGQTLADSNLNGGSANVEGRFEWKDSTIIPAFSDSQETVYDVVFTPTDEKHGTAECKVKLTVNKANSAVTKEPECKTPTYNGQAQELVTAGEASGGEMKYAVTTAYQEPAVEAYTFDNTSIPTAIDAGTYYVWYKVKGDENHLDSEPDCVEVNIAKRNITLTSSSDEKVYDGKPLTNNQITVSDPGWATGEGATYTVNGSQILPGTSSNTFEYTLNSNTKENNYIITQVFGTLKVNDRIEKYEIEVEANSESIKYDSSEHTVSGFETLDFTIDDVDYTVSGLSASAAATDAGTYMVEITGTPVVSNGNGDNLTSQFIVNTTPGRLVINKRNVTLTSASDSKSYDGEPLTNASVTVSGDGFVDGEGAYYNVTGNQTIVGSSSNEFTYTLNEGTKATNYDITTNNGTLIVTNRPEDAKYVINPQANSGSFTYDGIPHSVSGLVTDTFEVDTDETDKTNIHTYKVSGLTAERAETKAGEYTVNISGTAIVTDEAGNNVSSEFRVIPESGSMVINKRNVILTSATDTKVYDGKALTNSDVIVFGDGWAAGEGAKYAVSGTRTLPGESNNSFTYTLNDGTDAENYNITTEEGILTVTDRNSGDDDKRFEITVIANSGKYVYDGVEHEVSGFETNEFVINDVKYTVSGLEASAKGTEIGTYAVKVTGAPIVVDAEGNDVTNQFIVNTQDGELSIIDKSEEIVSYIDYKNTSGDGGIWTKGSGQGLEFVFKRSENDSVTFEHFTGIAVDKADVNPLNYTALSGSVVVTLKSEYLETLTVGEHQLTAYFDDGDSVTVSFKIISKGEMSDSKTETKSNGKEAINENAKAAKVKSGLAKTADKAQLLIPVLMLLDSIMAVIYIILLKKKVR